MSSKTEKRLWVILFAMVIAYILIPSFLTPILSTPSNQFENWTDDQMLCDE